MLEYALIALFIGCESFFSGSETGFYCVNRVRLRYRLARGWPGAAALRKLTSQPQLAITTMLIGTNVSVYLATVLCAQKLHRIGLAGRADLYSILIMPPLLLVFAEIVPKSLFHRHADNLMYKTAWPLNIAKLAFYPLVVIVRWLSEAMRSVTGRQGSTAADIFTTEKF